MAFDHVSALRIHTPPDGLTVVRTSAALVCCSMRTSTAPTEPCSCVCRTLSSRLCAVGSAYQNPSRTGREASRIPASGVAAPVPLAAPEAKAAETTKFDLLSPVQRFQDAAEHSVDDQFGVLLREVGNVGLLLHERRLWSDCLRPRVICSSGGCRLPRKNGHRGLMYSLPVHLVDSDMRHGESRGTWPW